MYDGTGAQVASLTYDAYGNTVSVTNPNGLYIPFRYRGYYFDEETGFYYLQSRYYDPETGRFLNTDSLRFAVYSGYNLFMYCNNNPIKYVDLSGYLVTEWDKAHLNTLRVNYLEDLTERWNSATSDRERATIHQQAIRIRSVGLSSGQYVDSCGFVRNEAHEYVISMTFYDSYIDYTISEYVIRLDLTQDNINDFVDDNSEPYFMLIDLTQHMLDNYLFIYEKEFAGRTARGLKSEIMFHYYLIGAPYADSHARIADLENSDFPGGELWRLFEFFA